MEALTTARMVNEVLDGAIHLGSTDVHLVYVNSSVSVSCRVDGKMHSLVQFSRLGEELFRRLKALARLDVTNRHFPQEGGFSWDTSATRVRVRMSSLPIHGGESIVLRLLPMSTEIASVAELGFTSVQLLQLERWLFLDNGLIVLAGRTGVGKTTTLYSLMAELAARGRQVFSLEDPVEVPLPNCRQIEIQQRNGFTYAVALRALLRQDPDVLMIGEIRDADTARIACQAALTGRLVLATTHAEGMRGTIGRLVDLGVERWLISDVLRGVIVQRSYVHRAAGASGIQYFLESPTRNSIDNAPDNHAYLERWGRQRMDETAIGLARP